MAYTVKYDHEGFIRIKVQGKLNLPVIKSFSLEVADIIKEENCYLLLSDYSEANIDLSTMEIYETPNIISDFLNEHGIEITKLKRALVVSNDVKDFLFFETVSQNRGHTAKVFHDIEEAKAWLTKKTS